MFSLGICMTLSSIIENDTKSTIVFFLIGIPVIYLWNLNTKKDNINNTNKELCPVCKKHPVYDEKLGTCIDCSH
jgi:hypothetical protein